MPPSLAAPAGTSDGWMCGPEGVRRSFARAVRAGDSHNAPHSAPDIAVIEGVMGLYDGASADGGQGSTAEVAALLDAPVLLVADVRGMSRSAAALVGGYTRFDPALRFAGVVCNRVGGPGHHDLLRGALAAHCPEVPLLGLLPRDEALGLPSRHLGLAQAHELEWAALTARLADWFEAGLAAAGQSLDDLLARCAGMAPIESGTFGTSMTSGAPEPDVPSATPEAPATPPPAPASDAARAAAAQLAEGPARRVRIGIARDAAFSFLYPENLFLLEKAGAEPVFFSPLNDAALPPALGGLLLPGGYPELHAARLAANAPMLAAVRTLAAQGRPVHGECGGFMYLMRSITDTHGTRHAMTGCLPADCRMDARLRALGYREAQALRASPFGPAGTVLRGHEFHYSRLEPALVDGTPASDTPSGPAGHSGPSGTFSQSMQSDPFGQPVTCGPSDPFAHSVWNLRDRNGTPLGPEGLCAGTASGSYVHLHFGSNPAAARAFVAACAAPGDIPCP
ncbi:cobyrinate a,c-diamide synthase [Nitratidesulfovibrio liaohensis]|uniref:Cobyrinate a,c-diamide synthase n=1 Tax=Nitratidesulfovibrio liaohensis TaxID=2604158 RepID=A0ABY9QZ05_9BACT|nr:cobyrinate a,c-diamide synthase [Nitratidesulfovibrio liaohensis]WMW64577.1 cobyrinate a,c-diamide synthase [Nitratidesulfovibrio liaohensis]